MPNSKAPPPPPPEKLHPVVGDAHHFRLVRGSWNPLRYAEGYAMGTIANLNLAGTFVNTLGGEIKLGHFSAEGFLTDEECLARLTREAEAHGTKPDEDQVTNQCRIKINPWPFAAWDHNLLYPLREVKYPYVVVNYRSFGLLEFGVPFVQSQHLLYRVYPLSPDLLRIGDSYESKVMAVSRAVPYEVGYIDGRVVLASLEGVVRKAHEVVIQHSHGGNIFSAMSVTDWRLFDFITKAMMSGHMLRLHYVRMYAYLAFPINLVRGNKTYYRIFKVETIPESVEPDEAPTPEPSEKPGETPTS